MKNEWKNSAGWIFYKMNHPEEVSQLNRNKVFKNQFKGKRCFILGNGPSLNNVNFSDLKDEYVFCVNQINRRPDFKELHSNFHFWADPNFFDINLNKPEDRE